MKIVVDSNIVFSALLSKDNVQKLILTNNSFQIFSCNFLFVEIFKHKSKIENLSRLDETSILEQLELIMRYVNFKSENIIPASFFKQAFNLCKDVDPKDTPFVALSLVLDCKLLTSDKKLFNHLKKHNFQVINIQDIKSKLSILNH
jgi:predicted nucleic acid-binding protein